MGQKGVTRRRRESNWEIDRENGTDREKEREMVGKIERESGSK